jgi:hypothetical protein
MAGGTAKLGRIGVFPCMDAPEHRSHGNYEYRNIGKQQDPKLGIWGWEEKSSYSFS